MVDEPILEVRDLRTEIRDGARSVLAVDGVSFDVREGEIVSVVGESGSGKTLTARSIIGLLPPGGKITSGSVRLAGRELVGLPERSLCQVRGNEIGMIFQDPMTSLNPTKRIGDQVAETLRLHWGWDKRRSRERAVEMLKIVEVPSAEERYDAYPHQLSGGMRQRVMIAGALACEPKILIADEPTTALDVTVQAQILSVLDNLRHRLAIGIVLITHDFGVVARLADRVEVMYAARIVEEGPVEDILERRRHPYTDALLRTVPNLHGERAFRLAVIPGRPPDLSSPPVGCRFAPRCARVQPACIAQEPDLHQVGDDGHRYRCFFPLEGVEINGTAEREQRE